MPYIPKKDYPPFKKPIDDLRFKIIEKAGENREELLGRLGYVALQTHLGAMPGKRYWTLAENSGIMHNIPAEMRRRLHIAPGYYEGKVVIEDHELDPLIEELVATIKNIANDYNQKANPPGSYPGAYAGLVNFPLTALSLRLLLDKSPGPDVLNVEMLRQIETLFKRVEEERYYPHIPGEYEDEQIAKETNGDLPEYQETTRRLKTMGLYPK